MNTALEIVKVPKPVGFGKIGNGYGTPDAMVTVYYHGFVPLDAGVAGRKFLQRDMKGIGKATQPKFMRITYVNQLQVLAKFQLLLQLVDRHFFHGRLRFSDVRLEPISPDLYLSNKI
jgi:hypothetical protein